MTESAFALFDTAVGRCGLVWGARGVLATLLPESDDEGTRARLRRRFPDAVESVPPPEIARAIGGIVGLLDGGHDDLADIDVDMSALPDFPRRVYEVVRTIEPGSTMSYGEVAERLGTPGAARAVGRALGANPVPIIVPCHRVLAAGRQIGGFSAPGGRDTKRRMLDIEGALTAEAPTLFDLPG